MSGPIGARTLDGARRAPALGRRSLVLALIAGLGVLAAARLGLEPAGLVPHRGGLELAREFATAALRPALDFEAPGSFEARGVSFLGRVLEASLRTVAFAAAACSLALALGLPLGFLASSSWWAADPLVSRGSRRHGLGLAVQGAVRLVIAVLRSVHELLYAVVFLAAIGTSTGAAVLAIALPYAGTLAKVFSEMLDEAPPEPGRALRAAGVAPIGTFLFGTLPRALPDMSAYAFYRFECGVRSSAVLGFFGFETLGHYLRLSFENLHYREVWTYLYALLLLVLLLEGWSALLRRRFVA